MSFWRAYILYQLLLTILGPPEKPEGFVVLSNHTSVALTLRWRPGFDGGYSPEVFTLQYGKSDKSLRTWKEMFTYETDGMTWYQSTVTVLQPQTLYVFSLYAENNRPRDKGPNRSLTVTQTGSTTGRAVLLVPLAGAASNDGAYTIASLLKGPTCLKALRHDDETYYLLLY